MKTKKIAVTTVLALSLALVLMPAAHAITLPSGTIYLTLTLGPTKWPGTVTFSGITGGPYDIDNGIPYTAWCAQFNNPINVGTSYPTTVVSSTGLPTPWDKINYLINHNTGEDLDEQVAIWLLLGFTDTEIGARYAGQPSADALAMYGDANTNGGGFTPSEGELVAVLCEVEGDVQDLFIQLRIPRRGEGLTPGFWKNHLDAWVGTGYTPGTSLDDPFDNPGGPVVLGDWTMLEALGFHGGPGVDGAERILLRAAVAALLNSASLDYPLTTAEVISQVNAALASNNRGTILALALELDIYNNLGSS